LIQFKLNKMEEVSLTSISIIGKFSDGSIRQIFIKEETAQVVVAAIIEKEDIIKASEKNLEGIEFT